MTQQTRADILIVRPLTVTAFVWVAIVFSTFLALAMFMVDYTRKERVSGRLSLDKGVMKIYPQTKAVIVRRFVKDGDHVVEGQPLFEVSVERLSPGGLDTQLEVGNQLASRISSLNVERASQIAISLAEDAALKRRIEDVDIQLGQIRSEIQTQQKKVALAETTFKRWQDLAKLGFASEAQSDEKEQENLEQRSRLQALTRSEANLSKDKNILLSEQVRLPLTAENRLLAIDRQLAQIKQEIAENESKRGSVIAAPQVGRVTLILADVGQPVSPEIPMLGLIPEAARLEAVLFVPSRASGFIEVGQHVAVRYQAYPYQKFGLHGGTVKEIGLTSLLASELKLSPGNSSEPYYRVVVALDEQEINAYGKLSKLQDGMLLDADIELDTRKLYEWVLEPAYSLTGTL